MLLSHMCFSANWLLTFDLLPPLPTHYYCVIVILLSGCAYVGVMIVGVGVLCMTCP